ncbi:hypothetical protein [Brucella intermedia]|uniref:hypothetical protein n=1 Tax=Brucella intermedia TaxID=94625 RepID=UPI00235E9BD7|nr:hypothetical protein [Brucella intermedia]
MLVPDLAAKGRPVVAVEPTDALDGVGLSAGAAGGFGISFHGSAKRTHAIRADYSYRKLRMRIFRGDVHIASEYIAVQLLSMIINQIHISGYTVGKRRYNDNTIVASEKTIMFFIFALLIFALLFAWFKCQRLALICAGLCLVLAVKEFLWEIHSPDYGYRMPWIQTHLLDHCEHGIWKPTRSVIETQGANCHEPATV